MKKGLMALVGLLLAGGVAWVWFLGSVYNNLWQVSQASAAGDLERVEALADLDRWAKTSIDYSIAYSEQAIKKEAGIHGGFLGKLVSGIAGAIAEPLKEGSSDQVAAELRSAIAAGQDLKQVGPFVPDRGLLDLPLVEVQGNVAYAILGGTCEGERARARVRFERVSAGPFGLLSRWRSVGMDPPDVQVFAAACVRGARAKAKAER